MRHTGQIVNLSTDASTVFLSLLGYRPGNERISPPGRLPSRQGRLSASPRAPNALLDDYQLETQNDYQLDTQT